MSFILHGHVPLLIASSRLANASVCFLYARELYAKRGASHIVKAGAGPLYREADHVSRLHRYVVLTGGTILQENTRALSGMPVRMTYKPCTRFRKQDTLIGHFSSSRYAHEQTEHYILKTS